MIIILLYYYIIILLYYYIIILLYYYIIILLYYYLYICNMYIFYWHVYTYTTLFCRDDACWHQLRREKDWNATAHILKMRAVHTHLWLGNGLKTDFPWASTKCIFPRIWCPCKQFRNLLWKAFVFRCLISVSNSLPQHPQEVLQGCPLDDFARSFSIVPSILKHLEFSYFKMAWNAYYMQFQQKGLRFERG